MTNRTVFKFVFILLSVLTLFSIWVPKYLPMIDLPQHAAQVDIWKNLNNTNYHYANIFFVNWYTPYISTFILSLFFHEFFGIQEALKITITLSLLGLPFSLLFLLKETNSDSWLAVAGFPVSFSFGFYWGFLSYILAVPLGVIFVALGLGYFRRPRFLNGLIVSMLGVLLFFTHALVFGICGIILGIIGIKYIKSVKILVINIAPYIIPIIVLSGWYFYGSHPSFESITLWGKPLPHRLNELSHTLLSNTSRRSSFLFGIGLFISPLMCMDFSKIRIRQIIPFIVVLLSFLFGPDYTFGIAIVYERLPLMIYVYFLCLFPISVISWRLNIGRIAITMLSTIWLIYVVINNLAFDKEARSFDKILAIMEPHKRVLSLVYDEASLLYPESYKHFAAWYQAIKGGEIGNSFAIAFKSPIQYKQNVHPDVLISEDPRTGEWVKRSLFDYYLVREKESDKSFENQMNKPEMTLLTQSEEWKLFQHDFKSKSL